MRRTCSSIGTTTPLIARRVARSPSSRCCRVRGCALRSDRMVSPRAAVFALSLLVLLASACELEKVAINRPANIVALHGMLSATAPSQVVLLERTRNGSVQLIAPPFDVTDPVVSDEGIAETGAAVTLQAPNGTIYTASEDNTTRVDGKGQGIYRFMLPGAGLLRNAPYRLTVLTATGATLTAETS